MLRATILNGSGHLTPWERACPGCTYIRQKVIEGLSEEQYNLCVKNVDQVGAQGKVLSTTEVACRRKPHKSWSSRLWVLRSLSCKTTLPKEIHQKVSNAILRVMLGDERTAPSMATTGQSHQGAEVWIHRKGTYTPRTWKLQKYPCSKTNIRNVTDEEVKQSKTVMQMNTKKCLYIRRWNIPTLVSNSSKMQQLVRALNYHRLHVLDITETHMSHSSDYIFPHGLLLLYSGRDDGMLGKSLQKE